jgi:putative Mn2+ efflux pump MntP
MDILTVLPIAVGLAMDCFAVSMTIGMASEHPRMKNVLMIATLFGVFQACMPIAGWLIGLGAMELISGIDHWIAFALLSFVGGRMIHESRQKESKKKETDYLKMHVLLTLSVATSIDALAIGLSFAFLRIPITVPVVVIGTITFALSVLGVFAGKSFGSYFGRRIEVLGGLVLIGIGVKILLEHLF